MFEAAAGTVAFEVTQRHYGQEHLGVSPSGASDQLAFQTARLLVGQSREYRCLEIVHPTSFTFTQPVLFVLTGAHYQSMVLQSGTLEQPVEHATVCRAGCGDVLKIAGRKKGLRLYLFAIPLTIENTVRAGMARGAYEDLFGKIPQKIRLIKGPEYAYLQHPEAFFAQHWTLSNDSNRMGIRLEGSVLHSDSFDIVSSVVDDGTIQLTPSGPIVLMRDRQTTGGYPRIFQVASVDIDLMAQLLPGSKVAFSLVTLEEAKTLLVRRQEALAGFANQCG